MRAVAGDDVMVIGQGFSHVSLPKTHGR